MEMLAVTDRATPHAPRSHSQGTYVHFDCWEGKILLLLARECSDFSGVGLEFLLRQSEEGLWPALVLERLCARRLVRGSRLRGFKLTEAGWALSGGGK
jgi:hypothetical protein